MGREPAVNNGQSRWPTDNQTSSLLAVSAGMGPQVPRWHARGQQVEFQDNPQAGRNRHKPHKSEASRLRRLSEPSHIS